MSFDAYFRITNPAKRVRRPITIYFLSLNTERIDRPTDGFCDPGNPRREPRAAPLHEHASVRHRCEQPQAQQLLRVKSQIPQKVMSLNKCSFQLIWCEGLGGTIWIRPRRFIGESYIETIKKKCQRKNPNELIRHWCKARRSVPRPRSHRVSNAGSAPRTTRCLSDPAWSMLCVFLA